jgi:hypothetical protein
MTAFVRWDSARARLVDDAGHEVTAAQDAKARRYLQDGLITPGPVTSEEHEWGMPWRDTQWYDLAPLRGCRQGVRVQVTVWNHGLQGIVAVDYRCSCQRAAGTIATRPTVCSHALAVHRFRRGERVLA